MRAAEAEEEEDAEDHEREDDLEHEELRVRGAAEGGVTAWGFGGHGEDGDGGVGGWDGLGGVVASARARKGSAAVNMNAERKKKGEREDARVDDEETEKSKVFPLGEIARVARVVVDGRAGLNDEDNGVNKDKNKDQRFGPSERKSISN